MDNGSVHGTISGITENMNRSSNLPVMAKIEHCTISLDGGARAAPKRLGLSMA
jgi:hypothetical protein